MEVDNPYAGLTKKEIKRLKKKEKKKEKKQADKQQKQPLKRKAEDVEVIEPTEPSFVRHNMKRSRKFEDDNEDSKLSGKEEKRKNSGQDFEDPFEDEFEDEDQVEGDWEDVDDDETTKDKMMVGESNDEEMKDSSDNDEEEKVDTVNPLAPANTEKVAKAEELVYDNSAYEMIHRATVEWPSLSIDILTQNRFNKDDYSSWFPSHVHSLDPAESRTETIKYPDGYKADITKHVSDKYPYEAYVVAGSQALKKTDNKLYVMKWCNLYKTLHDDDEDVIEDDNNEEDARLYYEAIPHRGGVNRVRSMLGSNIAATWSDTGDFSIFDLSEAIKRVDKKAEAKSNSSTKKKYSSLVSKFSHKVEGFALDWSPRKLGLLASGSCDSMIHVYEPTGSDFSEFRQFDRPLKGHKNSVEDIQFSPTQDHVLASCSVDKTIKLWDLREDKWKAQMSFIAHDTDVNVISWNTECKYLLASGSDDGSFKVWDLRKLQKDNKASPITNIKWHNGPITSIHFQPREECVLAVSSADNKLSIWDFSVEPDNDEPVDKDIPPQLMFLHQGQENIKEIRFHPVYDSMLVSTAEDSYNIFRPNFDPQEQGEDSDDEAKEVKDMNKKTKELQKMVDDMSLGN